MNRNFSGFDVVLGNPPFQAPQEASCRRGGGSTLWDRFVTLAFDVWCKPHGVVALIHPAGWRNYRGDYLVARQHILNAHVIFLSMFDMKDGLRLFNAGTRFDLYVARKGESGLTSVVNDVEGIDHILDLNKFSLIPNSNFDQISKLLASENEEPVKVLYSRSSYGSDKSWISKESTKEFQYPVLHSLRKNGNHYIIFSSRNDKGHFGVPKVVFGAGSNVIFVDAKGEYGLSQHCRAIVAPIHELDLIAQAMRSERFQVLMKSFELVSSALPDWCNKDALRLLRKDFWKEFV